MPRLVSFLLAAVTVIAASPPVRGSEFNCTSLFEDVAGSPCDQAAACAVGAEGTAECRSLVENYCNADALDHAANKGCGNLGNVGPTHSPTRKPTNSPTHFPTVQPTSPTEAPTDTDAPTSQPTRKSKHPDRIAMNLNGAAPSWGRSSDAAVLWASAVAALVARMMV